MRTLMMPQMRTLMMPHMRTLINKTGAFVFGVFVGFSFTMFLVPNGTHHLYWTRDTEIDLKVSPDSLLDISNRLNEHNRTLEDFTVAIKLYEEVKVLCWIMTDPENHQRKAMHVKKTWGARCNKLLFMSSEEDEILGTIALNVTEGRDGLWGKTKQSFEYIYENHLNDYDWFLKADDDTYVIVENLRYFLYSYSTESPIYFGCKFKPYVEQLCRQQLGGSYGIFIAFWGAGYVLSREAVRRLIEVALPNQTVCRQDEHGSEDEEIGKCLQSAKVIAGDSRDVKGRGRFFPFMPAAHLVPGPKDEGNWYWKYIFYKTDEGLDCCSDNAISFHYVPPNDMYAMDYLIYSLQPYGMVKYPQSLPKRSKRKRIVT